MRIAIVVGEESGDILGAGLMSAILERHPDCHFEGIGGERMNALGFESHFAQDRLAVMGFVEPLKRLPELLRIRKSLFSRYSQNKPDLFIGIDAPAFNTELELQLRLSGVKTVHYVSPSVWAWRQGRIKKIARSVDLMLTLFPFEVDIYKQHNVPVQFVGHPLADDLPLQPDVTGARKALCLEKAGAEKKIIALLPGSRAAEVERLGPLFLDVARAFCKQTAVEFIIPSANKRRHRQLAKLIQLYSDVPIRLIEGRSHEVMAAADFVLMASGTTTLEAMLLKKPMAIAYKVAPLSYWIYKQLVKVDMIGLPNLLAGQKLVPEFIQSDATVANVLSALDNDFTAVSETKKLIATFYAIHQSIRCDASRRAADAVLALMAKSEIT